MTCAALLAGGAAAVVGGQHSGGVSGMAKGIMYIDGQRVPFDGEPNVLSVIRKAGIEMPTFCYYSDLSVYGACRMCVVEDERGK